MSDTRWSVTPHPPVPSVFPQPELAYQVMRAFAMKCDERKSGRRCKSCGFLLRALDEIAVLRRVIESTRVPTETLP